MQTLMQVIETVRRAARGFLQGGHCDDWEFRATQISAAADYLALRYRDDAFVEEEAGTAGIEFGTRTALRSSLAQWAPALFNSESQAGIHFEVTLKPGDLAILAKVCGDLDYSEKIVVMTAAHALASHPMPLLLVADLGNLLFEEAYHLKIVSSLLNLDLKSRPWIAADKAGNWQMVNSCPDSLSYMAIEHALFEGRGAIASAKGVHACRQLGLSVEPIEQLTKIWKQETHHGILGFRWTERLCPKRQLPKATRELISTFVANETVDAGQGFRAKRQKYSAWLFNRFLEGTPVEELAADIKAHSRHCLDTGEIPVSFNEIARGADKLFEKCSS